MASIRKGSGRTQDGTGDAEERELSKFSLTGGPSRFALAYKLPQIEGMDPRDANALWAHPWMRIFGSSEDPMELHDRVVRVALAGTKEWTASEFLRKTKGGKFFVVNITDAISTDRIRSLH